MPDGLQIKQVYGFIFDPEGRVLIFEDEGKFNLPGGRPEHQETISETLVREVMEEVQVEISVPQYLGFQRVESNDVFAQIRMIAKINHIFPSAIDPSSGRKYSRFLVPPSQLNALLQWGTSGEKQIQSAIALASKLGIKWKGTKGISI
ncbi:MAG: NUDIX hydrolase [Actinomycetota bacterium]